MKKMQEIAKVVEESAKVIETWASGQRDGEIVG